MNKKPNDSDIWNKKPIASNDDITVKVQRMFPNCEKYKKKKVKGYKIKDGEVDEKIYETK